jgi:hypothetical protein
MGIWCLALDYLHNGCENLQQSKIHLVKLERGGEQFFWGVIHFGDFGCGMAELGAIVIDQIFFFFLKFLGLKF